jgi:hypothetical protein
MRKIVIATVGLAGLVSLAGSASATTNVQMSPSDLKAYCAKKGGSYSSWQSGAVSCEIGSGKTKVTIDCDAGGNCVMSHTMVLTKLKPSIIGQSGYSVSGSASNSAATKASAAGGASVPSSASASANLSADGAANTKKASAIATTNTGVATGPRYVIGGGGTMPSIGRPSLRQQ